LPEQQQRSRAKTTVTQAAAPAIVQELVHALLVEVDDGQVLLRHPARQSTHDPELVSDRLDGVSDVHQRRAELVQVCAEKRGSQPQPRLSRSKMMRKLQAAVEFPPARGSGAPTPTLSLPARSLSTRAGPDEGASRAFTMNYSPRRLTPYAEM
jgi:hypothetical protein